MRSKRKFGLNHVVVVLAVGCLLLTGALRGKAESAEETIKWRMQSVWPSGSLAYDFLAIKVCKDIETRTNGRLKITPYPPGSLAKVLETFDNVAAGAIDMAFSAPLYHARKIPAGLVEFGLPFSITGPTFSYTAHKQTYEFLYEFKDGEVLNILRDAYAKRGIQLLTPGTTSNYGFMTKFKAQTLEDFKGKKIRTFGLFSALAKNMGASPTSIPGAEQYMALQRGTVDGTLYPYYVLETYKLKEVVEYVVLPPVLPAPVINFYANLKKWQQLPEDIKQIVQETLLEDFKLYSHKAVKLDQESVDKAKEAGVEVVSLDDESVKKLEEISIPLWEVAAKKSEASARIVDLLKEYLKQKD